MSISRAFDENIVQINDLIKRKKYRDALISISNCLRIPVLSKDAALLHPHLESTIKSITDIMQGVTKTQAIENSSDLSHFVQETARLYKLRARCYVAIQRPLCAKHDVEIAQNLSNLITPTATSRLLTAASIQSNYSIFALKSTSVKRKLDFDDLSEEIIITKYPRKE